ncbi:hypothetical protein, partial [Isoptericola haloaureus]
MTGRGGHADQADPGRVPRLLGADRGHRLPGLAWRPGRLGQHRPGEQPPGTYRQAGPPRARLRAAGSRPDGDWGAAERSRTLE